MARPVWLIPCFLLAGLVLFVVSPTAGSRSDHGGLSVEPEALDFGTAWSNESFVWTVPIRNVTSSDISITGFHHSCGVSRILPEQLVVPRGGVSGIEIEMNLDRLNFFPSEADEIRIQMRIWPTLGQPRGQVKPWTLRGTVRQLFPTSARTVDFGDSLVRGGPAVTRTILLAPSVDLVDLRASCDEHGVDVSLTPTDRPREFALSIRVAPETQPASGSFQIRLHPTAAGGDVLPPQSIDISAHVVEDVAVSPSSISFAVDESNVSAGESLVVYSRTGRALVHEATILSDEVRFWVSEVAPSGPRLRLQVGTGAVEPGRHTAELHVIVRHEGTDEPFDVIIPVACHTFASAPVPQNSDHGLQSSP
jgi:hypothetical protein